MIPFAKELSQTQSAIVTPDLEARARNGIRSARTLREKQSAFNFAASVLALKARDMGFELTDGDAYRDPRVFGPQGVREGYGESNSLHKIRLARDYNLFRGGAFLADSGAHKPLGEWWESIGGTWGGRFNDGNHYSLAHEGMK